MDADDASSAEMRQPRRPRHGFDPLALDDISVDRLLTGTLAPASAPPGYARVAELLAATVAPPTPRELAGQASVLAELRAVTRTRASVALASPARPPRRRRRRAGLAVVVVVGALATGGVAAATTGHLPGPVREAARSILTISGGGPATPTLPEPAPVTHAAGSGSAGPGAVPSTGAPGRQPASAATRPLARPKLERLCRAYLPGKGGQQGAKLDAAAFKALSAAAGGDDKVRTFCERLVPADSRQKAPKEPRQDPPGGEDQGQGGPPAATTGGVGGQEQSSPPANPSSPAAAPGNDGTVKPS
jgi:hypothetical protein